MKLTLLAAAVTMISGCHKTDNPVDVQPRESGYGSGAISFVETDSTRLGFSGNYKPSASFSSDTAGQGAGGFIHDTTRSGKPLRGMTAGYYHTMRNGLLDERLLDISLYAPGSLGPGSFAILRSDSAGAGLYASVTFLSYSDSLGEYFVYQGFSGSVTVESADTRLKGTFSGVFRGLPPDTTRFVHVAYGSFDVEPVHYYFDY